MKHRCELRFRSHLAFTHASLSRVPLCVSWAFLVFVSSSLKWLLRMCLNDNHLLDLTYGFVCYVSVSVSDWKAEENFIVGHWLKYVANKQLVRRPTWSILIGCIVTKAAVAVVRVHYNVLVFKPPSWFWDTERTRKEVKEETILGEKIIRAFVLNFFKNESFSIKYYILNDSFRTRK